MWPFIHQYGYFFSLVLFILPVSIGFDALTGFSVVRKLMTLKSAIVILATVAFLSLFDVFWLRGSGIFPANRIIVTVFGVPVEEMLLFAIGFYNVGAILAWAKKRYA